MVSNLVTSQGGLRAPLFCLKKSAGFSLVELMIVVAIIGLLSAIAIPNFQKFQARSRTTEAKLQLAAVYTAEESFYSTFHIYHTCLNYMGYDPTEFKNTRFYAVGFTVSASIDALQYQSAISSGITTVDCPASLAATADTTFFEAGTGVGAAVASSAHIPANAIGAQTGGNITFTAGAGGVIHKSFTSAATSSAFTINEVKKIETVRLGY